MAERQTVDRESLGRLVREVWVAWAREQPRPKAHHLDLWEQLDEGGREVDRRIGAAVADRVRADEREQCMREIEKQISGGYEFNDGLRCAVDAIKARGVGVASKPTSTIVVDTYEIVRGERVPVRLAIDRGTYRRLVTEAHALGVAFDELELGITRGPGGAPVVVVNKGGK